MLEDVNLDVLPVQENSFIDHLSTVTDPKEVDEFGNTLVHRAVMEGSEALAHVLAIPGIGIENKFTGKNKNHIITRSC